MKALTFKGGIHPLKSKKEGKDLTKDALLARYDVDTLVIPMRQHTGAECIPCVAVGERVLMGQVIGKTNGYVCAQVHASVSGKISAIESRIHISGTPILSVIIENDHKDEKHESVVPKGDVETLSKEEIKKIVFEAGIVGMGGAAFPTHIKLDLKPEQKVDYFIVNGAECEPFLTADYRTMIECSNEIVYGIRAMLKAIGAPKAIIGIEDNKPEAIKIMQEACENFKETICVAVLKTKYPQGGEKQLIHAITKRVVPIGKLPIHVGVIVDNVSTCKAVSDAIQKGMPLVCRPVTVTGDVLKPQNLVMRVGTTFQDAIDHCGGFVGMPRKILSGGPMMGVTVAQTNSAISKGTTGITVFNEVSENHTIEQNCMRCGRCVTVCPMGLMPQMLNAAYNKENFEKCEKLSAVSCINCGCCTYKCPAKRHLAQSIDLAKRHILDQRAREAKNQKQNAQIKQAQNASDSGGNAQNE